MSEPISSKTLLTTMNMIYFSLVSVMGIFAVYVFYLNYTESLLVDSDEEYIQLLRYVLFGLTPIGISVGYFTFKQQLSTLEPASTLRDKLGKYQTAILIRSAGLEIPGLFGTIAAMLTGENTFLLFTLVIIVVFIILRPTPYTMTNELGLSQSEKSILENPDGEIE
jgi:uncharacterized membrane protein